MTGRECTESWGAGAEPAPHPTGAEGPEARAIASAFREPHSAVTVLCWDFPRASLLRWNPQLPPSPSSALFPECPNVLPMSLDVGAGITTDCSPRDPPSLLPMASSATCPQGKVLPSPSSTSLTRTFIRQTSAYVDLHPLLLALRVEPRAGRQMRDCEAVTRCVRGGRYRVPST